MNHDNGALKLSSNDFTTKYHPSTSTKSNILKGSEIIMGGSIIIPIDINVLATIISITRNGMKIMNPIWKADLSSLIAKAGINAVRGVSATPVGLSAFA
jgi:hypothetical protein